MERTRTATTELQAVAALCGSGGCRMLNGTIDKKMAKDTEHNEECEKTIDRMKKNICNTYV